MINIFAQSTKARSLLIHVFICALLAYLVSGAMPWPFIIWWFIVVNAYEFLMFGKDKIAALMKWRRTPESTFLLMGFLGAFPGIFLGRYLFNHKTSKKEFVIPMWILFILQIIATLVYLEQITVKGEKMLSFLTF